MEKNYPKKKNRIGEKRNRHINKGNKKKQETRKNKNRKKATMRQIQRSIFSLTVIDFSLDA